MYLKFVCNIQITIIFCVQNEKVLHFGQLGIHLCHLQLNYKSKLKVKSLPFSQVMEISNYSITNIHSTFQCVSMMNIYTCTSLII